MVGRTRQTLAAQARLFVLPGWWIGCAGQELLQQYGIPPRNAMGGVRGGGGGIIVVWCMFITWDAGRGGGERQGEAMACPYRWDYCGDRRLVVLLAEGK